MRSVASRMPKEVMAFSMLVGVIFGFIPANRAVKISALEAIRHD